MSFDFIAFNFDTLFYRDILARDRSENNYVGRI